LAAGEAARLRRHAYEERTAIMAFDGGDRWRVPTIAVIGIPGPKAVDHAVT
jgi:hypothetical protein